MITKAKFEGFKLLSEVEFEIGRFNVVVGENGTGKSSILEGLHYLLQLSAKYALGDNSAEGRIAALFQGPRDPLQLATRPDRSRFRIAIASDAVKVYSVSWRSDESGKDQGPFRMALQRANHDEGLREYSLVKTSDSYSQSFATGLLRDVAALGLSSVVRLRLDATQLAADHYSDEEQPRVEYDGTGLASVLQELHAARDGRFERLEADLNRVVPGVRRIRATRAKIVRNERIRVMIADQESWSEQRRELVGAGFEVEWGNVGWIPAKHLSEGTLLALGLFTVIHHRPPSLILLDDLDKALHPKAQRELVGLLRSAIASNDRLQVLATTHSPFVVDEFLPEDVLVVASADGSSSQVRRLSDHPTWRNKGRHLETGEFWSAVGEAWAAEKPA